MYSSLVGMFNSSVTQILECVAHHPYAYAPGCVIFVRLWNRERVVYCIVVALLFQYLGGLVLVHPLAKSVFILVLVYVYYLA